MFPEIEAANLLQVGTGLFWGLVGGGEVVDDVEAVIVLITDTNTV